MKKGYLYIVKADNKYKIGITKSSVKSRINEMQTGCPYKIEEVFSSEVQAFSELEKFFHTIFKDKNVNREWFSLDDYDIELVKYIALMHNRLDSVYFKGYVDGCKKKDKDFEKELEKISLDEYAIRKDQIKIDEEKVANYKQSLSNGFAKVMNSFQIDLSLHQCEYSNYIAILEKENNLFPDGIPF